MKFLYSTGILIFVLGSISAHSESFPRFASLQNRDATVLRSSDKGGNKFLGPLLECAICHFAAEGMLDIWSKSTTDECIEALAVDICELLKIEDDMVCSSIVPLFTDEVLYVLGQLVLSPDQFCGFLFPDSCGNAYRPRKAQWNVTFPGTPKPPVEAPTSPPANAPTMRVVHLSDIHYDKLYLVGSDANCKEPLCCRLYETIDNSSSYLEGGQWGSNQGNCDIPLWTLENLFQHLSTSETFDYIIWTGDLPAHNVWNQTKSDQLAAYQTLTDLFLKYFPNKKIYAAVGNHESSPVNSFPPHYPDLPAEFDISWLYDALSDSWTNWINKSESTNIKNIASFVEKPFPGLRIISLNTIYCYNDNYWVLINDTDPDNALSWLISQLQEAEDVGDKVHIIGHILTGSCMAQWSLNYYNIINRYENTVRGQFFGHTHSDQFAVFYENASLSGRATNMYYVGPSVTTYSERNPAYRVYTIDGNYTNSTWRVLNHETYFLNLTEVNLTNNTNWQLEYDAKSAYGLTTLFPEDWSNLILTMQANDTIFQRYYDYKDRMPKSCDANCKYDTLCEVRSAVSDHSDTLCSDLKGNTESAHVFDYSDNDTPIAPVLQRLTKLMASGKYKMKIPKACEQPATTTTSKTHTTPHCHCGVSGVRSKLWLALFVPTFICYFASKKWN